MKKNNKLMRVVLWILIIFMVVGMVLPAIMFHSFAYAQDYDFTVTATTSTVESGQDEIRKILQCCQVPVILLLSQVMRARRSAFPSALIILMGVGSIGIK